MNAIESKLDILNDDLTACKSKAEKIQTIKTEAEKQLEKIKEELRWCNAEERKNNREIERIESLIKFHQDECK